GERGGDAVVLVGILEPVGEDRVGLHAAAELAVERLDGLVVAREERVAEALDDDLAGGGAVEEAGRAALRLGLALAVGAEHDPADAGAGVLAEQPHQRAAAADLDV